MANIIRRKNQLQKRASGDASAYSVTVVVVVVAIDINRFECHVKVKVHLSAAPSALSPFHIKQEYAWCIVATKNIFR